MHRLMFVALLAICLMGTVACTDERKITRVKQTVVLNCGGKTMEGLIDGLLQNPVWAVEKSGDSVTVTVQGVIAGDKLPSWVKEQRLMDITFHFALDAKTGDYNPAALEGFPSLSTPEGVLQAYKTLTCS